MKKISIIILSICLTLSFASALHASEKGSMKVDTSEKGSMKVSAAVNYNIDAAHSTLGFAVKHLAIGTTRGGFSIYEGSITYDPDDYSSFSAHVTIKADSIDTKHEGRDKHLRNPDFFDVDKHPEITFTSKRLEKRGNGAVIIGDLTMKGVTKQLTLPVQISGPVQSPFGGSVMAINAQTTINRQDFGISWSKSMDNGGLVVADNVDLVIEIEAGYKG